MTTLSTDKYRAYEQGIVNAFGVIAADIIYEGAAVGVVNSTGYARPLQAGDIFVGFAEQQVDNSTGAAAAKNVNVRKQGSVVLTLAAVTITDIGQPVYATDDDTFTLTPVGGVFVGFVERYISSTSAVVAFDIDNFEDPYGDWPVREELTGTKTFDAQDTGKAFFVTAAGDGDALTLPAIADGLDRILIVANASYGSVQVLVSPNASDAILPPDLTATADEDLSLTKATQQRGDCVELNLGDADGYTAVLGNKALKQASTWTKV